MALLIDGYNLLHVTGIIGRGVGPGTLERSRAALLNFLAESIDPTELGRTTVVFDASDAPWGLPRTTKHGEMTVMYASKYPDADSLIEELIATDSAPRRLTVVSSDHRIQRAARRRKAQPIGSDKWYGETIRQRRERLEPNPRPDLKPPTPLTEVEVEYWLRRFGGAPPADEVKYEETKSHNRPKAIDESIEFDSPFPPGYAEDITEDDY